MNLTTSEPFWLVKNGLMHSYPSPRQDVAADVLIIGSGITGSLIAHQCVKDGHKTVVLDRREVVNGSSSATTSMLQYEIDTPLYKLIGMIGEEGAVKSYRACFESIDALGKVAEEVRSTAGFKKKDSLYFAARKKDVAWLKKEMQAREKFGFPVRWLEVAEIQERYNLHQTYGGILSAQGGSVDAFHLAHEILHFNAQKGLQIFDKTEIAETQYRPDGVTVITEFGTTFTAKKIIYCSGFESVKLIPEKIVTLLSTYALVGEQNPEQTASLNDILLWNTQEPYHYMRTTDDGRMLIGGGDVPFINPKKRDAQITRKTQALARAFHQYFPQMEMRPDFSWAGTFGETKDGLPYIGTHSDYQSTYWVLGFGGNGITFSVCGMAMVSEYLKGKSHPLEQWFRFGR